MLRFKCTCCGEWRQGAPSYAANAPLYYYYIPDDERETRCVLGTDNCVIDGSIFFVRGCLEIPVIGEVEPFVWGVWVSLSEACYEQITEYFDVTERSHIGPFFGWLSAELPLYPSTENLKTHVHLRDNGIRPYIELEPTDHPLSVEQRNGIAIDRVAEICTYYGHQ